MRWLFCRGSVHELSTTSTSVLFESSTGNGTLSVEDGYDKGNEIEDRMAGRARGLLEHGLPPGTYAKGEQLRCEGRNTAQPNSNVW